MDKLNSRCKEVTKEYKEKYDKLLSLVNGYEIASDTQNKNMQELSEIITNTKQLISESDFNALKNEQHNIMKDFFRLEQMKDEPYSNESQTFIEQKDINTLEKKSLNSNNLINIQKKFSIDSLQDINKKQKEKHVKSKQNPTSIPQQIQQQQPIIINPNDKNYQVLSNYQGSTPQIPSIQIVNVQEAPKCNNQADKPDLNATINKVLEKSVSKPFSRKLKPTHQDSNSDRVIEIVKKIKNPKLKQQVDKIAKAKKKHPNYFNQFIEDYTLHMRIPSSSTSKKKSHKIKNKKLPPRKIVNSKKCHNVNFIPNINNSSNNHSLF